MQRKTQSYLHLKKQNFKFSVAHFLIFDEKHAERLHGHNYMVQVKVGLPDESQYRQKGYFLDFNDFKKFIKQQCDVLDEHIVLPKLHPDIQVKVEGDSMRVHFRERKYMFPVSEVHLLPMTNTSVEQLSKYLCEIIFNHFAKSGIEFLEVLVEETAGQGASFTINR